LRISIANQRCDSQWGTTTVVLGCDVILLLRVSSRPLEISSSNHPHELETLASVDAWRLAKDATRVLELCNFPLL
jgi:hypothetical protein